MNTEQLDQSFMWRLMLTLCSIAFIIAAQDALASPSADPVGNALCKVIGIFQGNTARGIAVIGIIVLGIQTLRGKLQWEVALVTITAIIILFKAPDIVAMVSGKDAACNTTGIVT